MPLASLDILDFRNIASARLHFAPGLNLVSGENAAGKTSLLEAIYYLGRVRSFRTHHANQPIRDGQPAFRLVGQLQEGQGRSIPIGIERRRERLQVHLDGRAVQRLSDLAGSFPVQVISGDTETIIGGGPRARRQALDWALFHVEQGYREIWQRYARVLRQRNAALRGQSSNRAIVAWDADLVEAALQIDAMRQRYLQQLQPLLQQELEQLIPERSIAVSYQRGWPAGRELADVIQAGLERDRQAAVTGSGPHRADFRLMTNGQPLQTRCSRGQQKAAIVAFMLAQVRFQGLHGVTPGAFLLDDLGSELDAAHQARVLEALHALDMQVFVSFIGSEPVACAAWADARRFHVEHGEIQEMV